MVNDRISASSGAASLQQYTNIHYLRLFAQTDPGLFSAAIGGILLVAWDWRTGLILDSWAAGFVLVLLRYHPLMGHHPVISWPRQRFWPASVHHLPLRRATR